MTSLEYWKQREKAAAEEYAVTDEEALRRTQEVYARLLASVNDRINAFYSRYAAAEGITMNLAEQAVSSFDVKAFEATAAKMVAEKDFSPQANQQLRLYNATMRINRLEMLKAYIGLDTIDAGYDLDRIADYYLTDRSRQEFERQAGILGNSVRPTAKDVNDIVHSSFYNATFSQRIWASMSELHDELSTILTNGIIQGINPRQMTSRMAERFNVSEADAERLLRTEMARVQTETQKQSFQMAGFEYYVFISLEGKACPVCAALDTGEPISIEDLMPGETAPPVHPNCRCSVAAWMDREQMEKELGFALDEEEGEAEAAPEPEEAPFTTKAEAWDYFQNDVGIRITESKKYAIDDEMAAGVANWHRSFSRRFRNFENMARNANTRLPEIGFVAPSKIKGSLGMYSYYVSNKRSIDIKISGLINTWQKAKETAELAFEKKWNSGPSPLHTFAHEYGHYVSHSLPSTAEHDIITEAVARYKEKHPEYTSTTYRGLTDALSRYATTQESECFAEAFGEYFTSESPREFATIFGEILTKRLEAVPDVSL